MYKLKYLLLYLLFLMVSVGCCDDSSIPQNIARLTSAQASVKNEAALNLARCGSKADRAVPYLAGLIYDENVGVQSSAAYALRQIDSPQAREILKSAEERRRRR